MNNKNQLQVVPKPAGKLKTAIRSALMDWMGVPLSLRSEAFWSEWASRTSASGQNVNYQSMMTLSSVWSCVRLISETLSTLPLKLYRDTPTGRVEAKEHPLYNILLKMPNPDVIASVHWEAQVAAMLMRGAGRAEKLMFNGRVVGLEFLDPVRLNRTRNPDGTYTYTYKDLDGTSRTIPESRIFQLPGFTLNGIDGLSAIQYGYNVFGNALAADTAAGKTFDNGLMPTVYFYMDRVLKESQRQEFRDNTVGKITGALNAGTPPLLEGGMKAGQLGINPTDAQLLESRSFSVEEVCRWFRVPPWMVGHTGNGSTKWGTGMEQELLAFLTFTLRPWLTRIEQGVYKDLLSPAERNTYYAAYDLADFLKADSAARSAFYSVMVNNGIMTRDEVRKAENLPLMGGNADVLTVQSALVPLDKLGDASTASPAETALSALARYLGVQKDEH